MSCHWCNALGERELKNKSSKKKKKSAPSSQPLAPSILLLPYQYKHGQLEDINSTEHLLATIELKKKVLTQMLRYRSTKGWSSLSLSLSIIFPLFVSAWTSWQQTIPWKKKTIPKNLDAKKQGRLLDVLLLWHGRYECHWYVRIYSFFLSLPLSPSLSISSLY